MLGQPRSAAAALDEAVEWLRSWNPPGPWLLAEIDPNFEVRRVPARSFTDLDDVRAYLEARIGLVNLYFCPNLLSPGTEVVTTPTKGQVGELLAVYADLDLPKEGPRSKPTPENFARLLRRIEDLLPAPTAVTFTGGGYQGFWRFPAALPAAENLERAEAVSQAIARALGSDAVQNVNRWMRLPGTVNVPNRTKAARGRVRAEAYVVYARWDDAWSFDDPVPSLPDAADGYDVDADVDAAPAPDGAVRGRGLDDMPVKWQRAVRTGDAKDYGDDRSRLVFGFVTALVRRGWTDAEILPFLTDPTYPITAHVFAQADPRRYAARQVTQARERIAADWDRTARGALDPASPANVARAIGELGVSLTHNVFTDRYYLEGMGPRRPIDDACEAELRVAIHGRFAFLPSREILRDVMTTVARRNSYHPVKQYLDPLSWDGTPRLDDWLVRGCGADDRDPKYAEYVRACGRLILIAAVRRVRSPGSKFDQMLVLVDPEQGTGKSSAIESLCPNPEWFTDSLSLRRVDDQKVIEQLGGRWIVECADLAGYGQADVDHLKAFISRREDRARLAYAHHPVSWPRQCVLFGTVNSEAYLRDTENRRFWTVRTGKIDLDWLRENRDQLWAEAAHREAAGESDVLPRELWPYAAEVQQSAREGDGWADALAPIFGSIRAGRIASADVWLLLGRREAYRHARSDNRRLTEVMRELGWQRDVRRLNDGSYRRVFVKGRPYAPETQVEYTAFVDPVDGRISIVRVTGAGLDEVEPAPTPRRPNGAGNDPSLPI